jgi:rhodanese-related sulfurtransferase
VFARLMGLKTISPGGLHDLMQHQRVTVVDVNRPESWQRHRVPGAVNLDPVGFADGDLPGDKHSVLVFYCSNFMCRKAPNAARRAKQLGYQDVQVMSAGIAGWLDAALPTESSQT